MPRHSKGRTGNRLGREGFILPTGLFALILMTVLMVAALQLGQDERRSTRSMRDSGVALYVAEAGLARTVGTWPAGAAALNPGDSLNLGWTTLSNSSKYRAVLYRVDGGTPTRMYNIMIEGIGAGALGGRSNLTGLVMQTVTIGNGVVSLGSLAIGGKAIIDTYDSNDGYVAGAGGANLNLVSNGDITLAANTVVSGNLVTGGTWDGDGSVSGTYTPNVSPLPVTSTAYPTLSCPTTGYTPASDITIPVGSASSYDQPAGKFLVKDPLTIDDTPSNGAYYFDDLEISKALNISYSATPHPVTIYVHYKFLVSSGGNVNNLTQKPTLLAIKTCLKPGDPVTYTTDKFSLTGGAQGYMQLYAPNNDVVVGGGGDLFGSVVGGGLPGTVNSGNQVSFSGGSQLHYDRQLVAAGNIRTLVTGAWAEVQPF